MNGYKEWYQTYSDIMDYLHGRTMRAILEDDKEYFYEGRFTINEWKSSKDWSRIVIDYSLGPYKWLLHTSLDDWEWNSFDFYTGIIPANVFKIFQLQNFMKLTRLKKVYLVGHQFVRRLLLVLYRETVCISVSSTTN